MFSSQPTVVLGRALVGEGSAPLSQAEAPRSKQAAVRRSSPDINKLAWYQMLLLARVRAFPGS